MTKTDETDRSSTVGYSHREQTFRTKHEWDDPESLSASVLHAVAVASGDDPGEMDSLYDAIDPDALDEIFRPRPGLELRPEGGCLTFVFNGCRVSVYWDGRIDVAPADVGGG